MPSGQWSVQYHVLDYSGFPDCPRPFDFSYYSFIPNSGILAHINKYKSLKRLLNWHWILIAQTELDYVLFCFACLFVFNCCLVVLFCFSQFVSFLLCLVFSESSVKSMERFSRNCLSFWPDPLELFQKKHSPVPGSKQQRKNRQ